MVTFKQTCAVPGVVVNDSVEVDDTQSAWAHTGQLHTEWSVQCRGRGGRWYDRAGAPADAAAEAAQRRLPAAEETRRVKQEKASVEQDVYHAGLLQDKRAAAEPAAACVPAPALMAAVRAVGRDFCCTPANLLLSSSACWPLCVSPTC